MERESWSGVRRSPCVEAAQRGVGTWRPFKFMVAVWQWVSEPEQGKEGVHAKRQSSIWYQSPRDEAGMYCKVGYIYRERNFSLSLKGVLQTQKNEVNKSFRG